ncbi:nucleoplasmin-2 [Perognathus longimembris pacificus]|uniref:nucleoplasmin-2 n=1 Tax=Perognathus longimembris pacificus TaxID=214514 RepID=UPI0020186E92|nr:nucleoplasmin-2 [Perognathus longimembris pacificus]
MSGSDPGGPWQHPRACWLLSSEAGGPQGLSSPQAPSLQLPGQPDPVPSYSSGGIMTERETRTMLWGAELTHDKRICTFKPELERKETCKLVISTVCLGEKAKEELNRVEVLTPESMEDRRSPVTLATLKPSVLPMVAMSRVELSPPVVFQLRTGSGPVFLSGQECYELLDSSWAEEEEEEFEEEEVDVDDDDDDGSGSEADVSAESTSARQGKRLVPHKQMSVTKKKKLDKEEAAESSLPPPHSSRSTPVADKTPARKTHLHPYHEGPGP